MATARPVPPCREASRVLQKAQDTIRESVPSRMRASRLRAGLRTWSSPSGGRPPWAANAPARLSKRESQVLGLIVDGKTSKQIAAELGISFKTVVTHRASIMSKMDVHESTSVVREAIRRGLV
jgi:DNA-binding NarL/FixJ family response regulator